MEGLKILTTKELAQATAGGDDYIRTKNNVVRGLALNRDYNPDAPEIIVFGQGPNVQARARLFFNSGLAVPTYIKDGVNAWRYVGKYRATRISDDRAVVQKYGTRRRRYAEFAAGVLFLEPAFEPIVEVSGGGFADPQTRKEVENAAMKFVTDELVGRGYQVHDHHRDNGGYDLLAVSASERLLIEVKGTNSLEPRFFLTRNERRCSAKNNQWRLFIVCNALGSKPVFHEFAAEEMHKRFSLDPLAWECTLQEQNINR